MKLCLSGNTNVAKRADDEFDSRIFFKESNHAFRDARVLRIFEGWRNFGNFFFFFPFSIRRKLLKKTRKTKGDQKRKSYLRYLERIAGDCDFIIHRGWLWPLIFIAGSSLSFNIVERKPVLWNFHANLFTWAGSRTGVNQPRPE